MRLRDWFIDHPDDLYATLDALILCEQIHRQRVASRALKALSEKLLAKDEEKARQASLQTMN